MSSQFVLAAIYDLWFHPLAHIPGPFFSRISKWPSAYHAWKGDRHVWMWQNFEIYGHKWRLQPDVVVYNDAKSWKQIYNFKANVQRSTFYKTTQRNDEDVSTLSAIDKSLHARKRKILNYAFTDKAVRAACEFVNAHLDRWHELLVPADTKEWTTAVNITPKIDALILDILGDLCFGRSFETKEPGDNPIKSVPHAILEYLEFLYPISRSPFLELFLWLRPRGLDKLFDTLSPGVVTEYFAFLEKRVDERLAEERQLEERRASGEQVRLDMFHFLAQAKDDAGNPMLSRAELSSEANLLMIAGSDSTSIALAGFFFYITQNRPAYNRLVQEIRSAFNTAEEIVNGPQLTGCTYLRACVDEVIRLVPPGGAELPRTVLKGGMEVDGDFIPEGMTVAHSEWCTGRNEQVFKDPNVFRPERWLVDDAAGVTEEDVARAKTCQIAFSYGPGACPGKNLAIMEMLTVIGRTLFRFDVRREANSTMGGGDDSAWGRRNKHEFQFNDAFIGIHKGPMLQFKRAD